MMEKLRAGTWTISRVASIFSFHLLAMLPQSAIYSRRSGMIGCQQLSLAMHILIRMGEIGVSKGTLAHLALHTPACASLAPVE